MSSLDTRYPPGHPLEVHRQGIEAKAAKITQFLDEIFSPSTDEEAIIRGINKMDPASRENMMQKLETRFRRRQAGITE